MIDEVRKLLANCSEDERLLIYRELGEAMPRHPFEQKLNTTAHVILEALDRASDLTVRGIRGVIAEACFHADLVPQWNNWKSESILGDLPYDAILRDSSGTVTVQVKMQRKVKGEAWIRKGEAVVEVQRTRGGTRNGEETRPYRYGEFDILAVCMEPSRRRWDAFLYIPQSWLKSRPQDTQLIDILQPVSLEDDNIWTSSFDEAVRRFRAGVPRP